MPNISSRSISGPSTKTHQGLNACTQVSCEFYVQQAGCKKKSRHIHEVNDDEWAKLDRFHPWQKESVWSGMRLYFMVINVIVITCSGYIPLYWNALILYRYVVQWVHSTILRHRHLYHV
uniref:Uncharacterized protein n=1 Tax=Rhipicephalus zambeziensis TaxID=60191 RepID=A0A224YLH7_9ACAR